VLEEDGVLELFVFVAGAEGLDVFTAGFVVWVVGFVGRV
jgi:hypothetical protein